MNRFGEAIRWKLHIPAPPERVFDALNTDEGRRSYWAESAVERDGAVHFEFSGGLQHTAPILTRERPSHFELRYFGSVATFELAPDGDGGTDLTLTDTGVAEEDWHEVHAGWLNVLLPMKAAVAYGVDLRNHDPDRTWQNGFVDQ